MSRFVALLCAIAIVAFPLSALADSFKLGNVTGRALHFSLRCKDGNDSWHNFTLNSLQTRDFLSGDWDYSCDTERYELRIGTNESDGSTSWQTLTLTPGNSYALVKSKTKGYTAHDTRYLIAMRNDSTVAVHVNYRCTDGADSSGTVVVQPFETSSVPGWFYVQGCTRFNVMTRVVADDGSASEWSKDVDANQIYRIFWNSSRREYVLQQL